MAKIIWNPSAIEIPQNSAVLLCGAQNSGKSTFAVNHFESSMILSSDRIFLEVTLKNSDNIFSTPTSVFKEAESILAQKISEKSGQIAVIDDVFPEFNSRMKTIDFIRKYFKNIILISLVPDFKELLSRAIKPNDPNKLKFGFRSPSKEEILRTALTITNQINSMEIAQKTNKCYVFTSSISCNNCKVHF